MLNLIKRPVITEKTVKLANDHSQYTFEVDMSANKYNAAEALVEAYSVKPENITKVRMHVRLGKKASFGKKRSSGMRAHQKFAVFTLDGAKIDEFTQ
jgi:ribosomal protein L23